MQEGPLRVVHVVNTLITGGMERGVTTLARHSSSRFEHAVLCLICTGDMARLLPAGTVVTELHKPEGHSLRWFWKLVRTLRRLRPQVLHTRNWQGMDAILAARLAGVRGIVHGEHGWQVNDATGSDRKRQKVRRFLSRWVTEFTSVSRHLEGWLREEVGIRHRITQIYNGVDTEVWRPGAEGAAVRAELGIPPDAFVAGIVARMDPIKDHATLLRAFAAVRARHPGARLLVVGDGEEEERLRALACEGIHFLGHREDVPRILRATDVFALSSLNEGISNTVLEAMATGLPVVATRVGGNPELVEEGVTGRLVASGDADGLADAIAAYAADRALVRAHGAAGRQAAISKFSIRQMVEAYEEVWSRVAAAAS
ncbi:MAG: glycosyltransferase [Planctomycetota bacterium]|jgi:sugar transferase (PEP-CTERM/EpsH1 system associated)